MKSWIALLAVAIFSVPFRGSAVSNHCDRIRWHGGVWDASGVPHGRLLTDNPRWFGERVFTGATYRWEKPPTEPADVRMNNGRPTPANRLLNGLREDGDRESECVGRNDGEPVVAVFDFQRPCGFAEVDVVSSFCTNATGFVEFSGDGTAWGARRTFRATSTISRVRLDETVPGRFMRLSFQAEPDAEGRAGTTSLDEVYAWGDAEVSPAFPEAIPRIPPGDALHFPGAKAGALAILPMPTPQLGRKPSGETPAAHPVTMARNETESRYFAIVNGTGSDKVVSLTASGFGAGVQAELLVGGVMQMSPPKRKVSAEEMVLLATDNENGINLGDSDDLDLLPFFFADAIPAENFLRRYLANPAQVAGFPDAVPLEPGEGCVVMLRITTDGAAPGARMGALEASVGGEPSSAGDAAPRDARPEPPPPRCVWGMSDGVIRTFLPIPLTIVDLALPPQSLWIYAYEPFTRQIPFETESRMRRDVERYAGIGATTTMRLPEQDTKERLFFDRVPQASVGSLTWCDPDLFRRVSKGEFESLADDDKARIVADARDFLSRGLILGLPLERIVAFLPDEPRLVNVRSVMSLARLVKEAVPTLPLHSDPLFYLGRGKGYSPPDEIADALLPDYNAYIDISCPKAELATEPSLLRDLWLRPRLVNAMYNHPAGKTGRETVFSCRRHGFNGFAYYCYCHPNIDVWDIRRWGVLNLSYQAVMPLGEDVALTPLYETLREAAEDARLLDALEAAGKDNILAAVLERSKTAWDRSNERWKRGSASAEDILDLRETALRAFAGQDAE